MDNTRMDTRSLAASAAAALLALVAAPARADPPPAGFVKHDNLSSVFGIDGHAHTASCSGYPGTDSSYKFWTRRGSSKNLVVYFEGGGACWDNLTCTFPIVDGLPATVPQFYVPAIGANVDPGSYDGLFSASNPANPVKDWNFVYIPYCSGDVHSGSATRIYDNYAYPAFPLPPHFPIHHGGFDNFMVVMDWVRKNVKEPERVLVAGSSAGGYGASINFPWVKKVFPEARLSVIADASQGVTTANFDGSKPGRGSWNQQLPPWIFSAGAPRSADILRQAAAAYPKARVAQFTTQFDGVQTGFYGVMKQYYGPGGSCANVALDWHNQMVAKLQSYDTSLKNFRHYLADGSYHTILRSPQFYSEASAGVLFNDWFAAMLKKGDDDEQGDDDRGPYNAWKNVSCPGCLAALPCP